MSGIETAQLITTGWCLAWGVEAMFDNSPGWALVSLLCAAFNLVAFFN